MAVEGYVFLNSIYLDKNASDKCRMLMIVWTAVECPTLNRENLGLNPFCYRFEAWMFLFYPRCLAIDGGGNMSEVFARNCCY